MKVSVCHNGDDVFISWKPPGPIEGCRGFALRRRRNGADEVVKTWVGFAGQKHKQGERRDSTQWPIQRFQWTDYMADPGDRVAYQVVPMVGPDKDHLSPAEDLASAWTDEFTLDHQVSPHIDAYFNRGIVAAQWVSRRLHLTDDDPRTKSLATKKLEKVIDTPDDPFRNYLTGPLGARLFELLAAAANEGREVFAALYELDDKQLESELGKLGKKAHIVLANGSVEKKGDDQNAPAREQLEDIVDLHDRMVSPRALGHNKFLVICDENNEPRWTWTGSQNWTKTGLCTQANNSVLIDDPRLAGEYRKQWDRLKDAEAATPDTLKQLNSQPHKRTIASAEVTLWFTPTIGQVDLAEAREAIDTAERAILFLMFNPGPRDTLLNHIIEVARKPATAERLYIKGAINQDPSVQNVKVPIFAHDNVVNADFDVVLPAAVDTPTSWFVEELKKLPTARAMVHSKVVLIDPFSAHPVVMTGSHNLGIKASGTNDENFLIIRDAPGLASAYATNIMAVYNQYRWRFNRVNKVPSTSWDGLKDNESWQPWLWKDEKSQAIKNAKLREMDFWVGD